MVHRKIIAASLSGTFFAIMFGFLIFPFHDEYIGSPEGFLLTAISITAFYLMYSFPVFLFYGVVASIISDRIGEFFSNEANDKKVELIVSTILHISFGLLLLWEYVSVVASILYLITDRLLSRKNKHVRWQDGLKSLAIPITIWLLFIGIVWSVDSFR